MRRLRFFRVLLPVLVLPFVVVLALQFRSKPSIHNLPSLEDLAAGAEVDGADFVDFDGGRRAYSIRVGTLREEGDGRISLRDIQRLLVDRADEPPLIVRAERGGIEGGPGERLIALEGGVEVEEEDEGLQVFIPELEIDQVAGQARSIGAVRLRSPSYEGTAGSVVYGLDGRPTRMLELSLRSNTGETLDAERAILYDGTRDMELEGQVRLTRGEERLEAGRIRVRRFAGGGVRHVVAQERAHGLVRTMSGQTVLFEADRLEVQWGEAGEPRDLRMYGDAALDRDGSRLSAATIEATLAEERDGSWDVHASGDVRFHGETRDGRGELSSRSLRARVTALGDLQRAHAVGDVEFLSADNRAEAEEALLRPGHEEEVVLVAGESRRARIGWSNTRVVAERIVTDRGGARLDARGRVEATLLPDENDKQRRQGGLFQADEVVHFVAARLSGQDSGAELTFSGAVRSWQGDRTLSADEVFIDQRGRRLRAVGDANTRIPRSRGKAALSQADFLQVSGEVLDYSERDALAVYTGSARVRQAEGWLEADRVEIAIADGSGEEEDGVREVRAFDHVHFEYRSADAEKPRTFEGDGDQLVYTPADQTIWLYGQEKAATVQRGEEGGVAGRVLRYRLDVGTLKVESGAPDRVKIRTTEGGR